MARFKIFDGTNWVELIKSSDFNGYFANAVNNPAYNPTIVKSSPRNFESGTLITTAIDYSVDNGAAFYMEIKGDLYGNGQLFTQVHGYIYYGSIINYGVNNLSDVRITQLIAMNIDGHLCFWFPRLGYWHSFSVVVNISSDGDYHSNYVISVTDSADVTTATKRIDLAYGHEIYSINSANIGSQSVSNAYTVDGEHAAAFAHRETDENLIAHGNEFNFVPSGYGTVSGHASTDVYFNFRTAGGMNGNITSYILGNGAGGALGTIIHSGNIGSQSVNYANSAGAVEWANVANKPNTFTPSNHDHYYIAVEGDNRSVATTPSNYYNSLVFKGLKYNSVIGLDISDYYSYVLGLRGWSDNSGGYSHEFAFNDQGIYHRRATSDSDWTSWSKIAHTSDIAWQNIANKPIFATVATSGSYSDLSGRPTNVSSFTNDSGYATQTWVGNNYQPAGSYAGTTVATQSANGLMSSTDKTRVDTMWNVWSADDGNDTLVNKIQEVLTAFNNFPEASTLVGVLATKANASDYLPLSGGTMSGAIYFGDTYHRISQEDGSTLSLANSRSVSLPVGGGTKGIALVADEGSDYGLLYIGSDGAFLANSGDNGYLLKVYDKDAGSDIFKVGQNGSTSQFTQNLEVVGDLYVDEVIKTSSQYGIRLIAPNTNSGSWNQGVRIYPSYCGYSTLALVDQDNASNVFAMVHNHTNNDGNCRAYFDYSINGSNVTIQVPHRAGTMALTSDIPTIPSSLPANGGNADTVDGYHAYAFAPASGSSNYLERVGWWDGAQTHSVDDLVAGITFAYANHGAPTTGTLVSFSCSDSYSYQLQLQGCYATEQLFFRNRNGDTGTWNSWREVIHSGNIGSQSVSYATSSGNATTAGGLGVHSGRNNEANKIVRTQDNGYIHCGYINSDSGDENNSSAPARIWGTNGSDSYLRTYNKDYVQVGYAANAGYATSAGSATDSTKIPLSGTSSLAGNIIPSTNASSSSTGVSLGSSSKYFNTVYTRSLLASAGVSTSGEIEISNSDSRVNMTCEYGDLKIFCYDGNNNSTTYYLGTREGGNKNIATREWVNGQGYLTSSSLSGYATQTWVQNQGYSTFTGYSSSNKLSTSYISGLATVATSGSYNDLGDKPTIPTVPTNVSAFTNDAGYISSVPYTYSSVNVNFNRRLEATCLTATTPYDLARYANAYYYADMIICENSNSAKTHKFLLPYYSKLNETFTEEIIATRTWASSKIYRHNIYIYGGGDSYIRFSIDSTINTAMNAKQAIEALYGSLTNNATSHVPVAFFSDSFNRYGIGANHFINNINYSGNILKVFQINFSYCMSGMYRDCYVESMYAYFNESNGLSCTDNFYEI